jgi:hypothetical protein
MLDICVGIRETSPNIQLLDKLLVLLVEITENLRSRVRNFSGFKRSRTLNLLVILTWKVSMNNQRFKTSSVLKVNGLIWLTQLRLVISKYMQS